MTISRNFDLHLNKKALQTTFSANQYDSSETWIFTLYDESGLKYTPTTASIVGKKADGNIITNSATVDSSGRVVVTETEQMTACAGRAEFELQIDSNTHGTANFIVMVEPSPTEGGTVSDSDLSLIQEAIDLKKAVYDVRNYDILPDSETDVYAKLFALVKQIEGDGKGGIVFFPKGEYILSDTIFIPANTIFVGEGKATRIIFNETYTSFGTALSNGGDNCGVMNMTVDCLNSDSISSSTASMTGGIGFSTVDGTSVTSAHSTSFTRRNTKNVFAYNIWTNTRYVLQTETDATYTIDGVTYQNIHAENSCVSVQARASIRNVQIANVICSWLRIGFNNTSYYDAVTAQINNVKSGYIWLFGNVQASNIISDAAYKKDTFGVTHISVGGNVSITNSTFRGTRNYSISRNTGILQMSNVISSGATKLIANDLSSTDATWDELYLSNCNLSQTGTETNVIGGIASNCDIDYLSTSNDATTIRNRQTNTYAPTLGSNTNISASNGRSSKIEVYDRKIVRLYLNLVLNDTSKICTLPKAFLIKENEPIVGYAWNSSASPIELVPCICSIGSSGDITALPTVGSMSSYNRFIMDVTYMLD